MNAGRTKRRWGAALCAVLVLQGARPAAAAPHAPGAGLPAGGWPAGTFLSWVPESGQITTFHRGALFLAGKTAATVFDISDPLHPVKRHTSTPGMDGHLWWKIGDLFLRDYGAPEATAQGYRFLDLSDPLHPAPWTRPGPLLHLSTASALSDIRMFPHTADLPAKKIYDVRSGAAVGDFDFNALKGIGATALQLRVGNLWFFVGREGFGDGLSVFDVGNPANPRLLDVLPGDFRQYTDFFGVWRNHVVFMHGDNDNGGNNLVAVDFADPTDLKIGFGLPASDITSSRYVNFQDEYAFAGRFTTAVKVNLETLQVERTFAPPAGKFFPDFQAVPVGPLLVLSGSEGPTQGTFLYAHQDGPDVKPPYVGHHVPADGAVNLPLGTVVGLVINETLDDTTLNGENIQLRPVGLAPLAVDVASGQHNVVNVVPRQPLQPNTTYEVRVVEGGVKDAAGNGIVETVFTFSTGDVLNPDRAPVISEILPGSPSPLAQGTPAAFTAQASDPEGGALQYRWEFSDGAAVDWSASSATVHAFAEPGNHQVFLQVRDAGGQTAGLGRTWVASAAAADASTAAQDVRARLRSGPVIVDGSNRRVWVANPDSDTVSLVDPDAMTRTAEFSVGKRPLSLSLDAAGRAWVVCRDSDQVRVLGPAGALVRTIPLPRGSRPVSVVMNPAGTVAYVAESATGRLKRFDTDTFGETGSLSVGPAPSALALSDDGGKLFVSRFISEDAGGEIRVVDLGTFTPVAPVALPPDNATSDTAATGRGLPNYVAALALAPGGTRGWYGAKKDNIFRGAARDGQALGHDNAVRALVGSFDPAAGTERTAARIDVDNNSQPSALALDPYGAHVLAALQGNNRVVALDQRTGQEVARAAVGAASQGVAVDPVTRRIFVQNLLGRSVTVLDGSGLILDGAKSLPVLRTVQTAALEPLAPAVLEGKKLFYDAEDPRLAFEGYISCAVCHVDGSHDGRTWDFTDRGEGLRNTIPLRGRAGTAHGRVHWSANFDEIQDFEHDIRDAFGGSGLMGAAHFAQGTRSRPLGDPKAGLSAALDALAAYVTSLAETAPSPHKNQDGSLTAQGAAGEAVFQAMNCAVCHTGGAMTDSPQGLLHDVGTLRASSGGRLGGTLPGLDTPTLKGLWDSGPYLHDGSAAALTDVLNHPQAARHGGMNVLTAQEKSDLIAYLLQLDDEESEADHPALLSAWALPSGNLEFDVAVTLRPGLAAPEVLVDGVSQGPAAYQPDGAYHRVVTVAPGRRLIAARATRADGGTSLSREIPVGVQAPTAPADVAAAQWGDDGVRLTWTDNALNEDGFQIERSHNGGPFVLAGTAGAGAAEYVNGGLAAGIPYSYRVRAFNDGGVSVPSNVAGPVTLGGAGLAQAGPGPEAPRRLLTPGRADGRNDALQFGDAAEEVEILNTSGQVVHRASGAGAAWDGAIGGRPAPSGLYIARVRRRDGSTFHQKILVAR